MKKYLLLISLLFIACVCVQAQAVPCTPPPGGHCVDLTWQASTTSGVTYNIYRGTTLVAGTTCTGAKLQSGITGLATSDMSVVNGTTYYYQVSASNTGGESTCTSQVQVQIGIPPGPPSNPTGTVH